MQKCFFILLILSLTAAAVKAQEDSAAIHQQLSSKFFDKVSSKSSALENKINKKSAKTIASFKKQEDKIRKKLERKDSLTAAKIFDDAAGKYKELEQKLQNTSLKQYIPRLDSLSASLKFLEQNPQLLSAVKETKEKLKDAMDKVKGLENQFQRAGSIKEFMKERRQYLRQQLESLGFARQLKKINKRIYYASQQINEYKNILNDPKKIERKALQLLSKTKMWQGFFRKNSLLASLFRMPMDPNDPNYAASLAGLQTRSQVNNLIQTQLAAGGPNARQQLQQNLQAAQSQLSQLKDKVLKFGGGSSDADMPEGFSKNDQKTKSFLKRLEYSANLQPQKGNNYWVNSADIGLSLGYKLNDKSVIGIGGSYRLGLGRGWNDIRLSAAGSGLRSFIDWKIKGSFWISGGYEKNYRNIPVLNTAGDSRVAQTSGLIGISKKISLKTKFFKQTTIKLLWDFMAAQQRPRTQPVVIRFGYGFSQ